MHNLFQSELFGINPAFWSLGLEAQLYFTVPLLLILARRYHPAVAVGTAFTTCLAFRIGALAWLNVTPAMQTHDMRNIVVMVSPPSRWFEFALGLGAAYFLASGRRWLPWRVNLLAAAVLFATAAWLVRDGGLYHPLVDPLFGVSAFLLVVGGREERTPLHGLLTHSFFTKVGQFSFSVYLLHEPLLRFLAGWAERLSLPPAKAFLLCLAPGLCVSLAAGIVFYRLVEAPSHRLAKRWLARERKPEPPALLSLDGLAAAGA